MNSHLSEEKEKNLNKVMDNKLLKYNEFLNEGLLDRAFRGVKSLLIGSKKKIRDLIDEMVRIEKDFINKTDELSYSIHMASIPDISRRSRYQEISPLLKQKGLINRRAMDALSKSKDSQIAVIQNKLERITKEDKDLIDYYNREASNADLLIAQYAYNKAKKHGDSGYSDPYMVQFREMERLRRSLGEAPTPGDSTSYEDSYKIGYYEVPLPYSLKWDRFLDYIKDKSEIDLLKWKNEGGSIKIDYQSIYNELNKEINNTLKTLREEKNNYPERGPMLDARIDEEERNKKILLNMYNDFKSMMRLKMDYLARILKITN